MLYIDDKLPRHPKIMKAGALLGGGDGPARALAMFLDGLSYTRSYLTDGMVPDQFVAGSSLVREPLDVARVLADRRVGLWHRVRGGYRFHDFHEWNKSAKEIKEIRKKWREKKAAQRRGGNGNYRSASADLSPGDAYRDSRARVRYARSLQPQPQVLGTPVPRSTDPGSSTAGVLTAAPRRNLHVVGTKPEKIPTHRILCAIARAELDRGAYDDGAPWPDFSAWAEAVKRALVAQGFAYPAPHDLTKALEAVEHAVQLHAARGSRR